MMITKVQVVVMKVHPLRNTPLVPLMKVCPLRYTPCSHSYIYINFINLNLTVLFTVNIFVANLKVID